jgi:tripartite-type tricarboxylate transporter receptor subunit TctC
MAPEFPTLDESGLKGYEVLTWFGILAPAGTPQPIVNRLNEQNLQAVAAPAVRDQLLKMGFEVLSNTPQEFSAFLKAEHARWGKVVRELGLKAE